MSKFAQILKEKRAAMNLSLRSAAELIGISHTYLDKLEKGFDSRTGVCNKPTPDTLKLISDTYDISYIDLLKYCGYIPEAPSDNIKPELLLAVNSAYLVLFLQIGLVNELIGIILKELNVLVVQLIEGLVIIFPVNYLWCKAGQ